jgi:hypothetical protein
VSDTRQRAFDIYRDLLQNLRPWRAAAPKLPREPEDIPETPQPAPPPFIVSDEHEIGEAVDPAETTTA